MVSARTLRTQPAFRRAGRTLHALTAAVSAFAILAAPVAAETPMPAGSDLTIRVGQAETFSRIEFQWASHAGMTVKRQGQVLTLSFGRDAKPDLADLHTVPLKWVKSVQVRHDRGAITFVLTLTDDADALTGEADGSDFVNVFQRKPDSAAAQAPSPSRPDPTPLGGVVAMRTSALGQQLRFDFPWRNPCGAAVFRRGDAIWIVFDVNAKIDVSNAPKNVVQYAGIQSLSGGDYSAVRITTRAPVAFSVQSDGSDWGVTLEPMSPSPFTAMKLRRDDSAGPAALTAALAGASGVYWVDDPAVGDKIGVVTALGPPKGVTEQHDLVQLNVLQSAQGMAIESHTDDLNLAFNGDIVTVSTPKGLALSPSDERMARAEAMGVPQAAALPGLIGADWSDPGPSGFVARYDALQAEVADEDGKGQSGPSGAHMGFARFLVGMGLDFEAIGVLDGALKVHPGLGGDAEFRALRGMARAMARRYKEAETDLSAQPLDDNAPANLWRGYVLAKTSQWADAKKAFTVGSKALAQFPAVWRQRFARSAAKTALALGDTAGARSWINYALANLGDPDEDALTKLVDAQVQEQQGDGLGALARYQALETSPRDDVSGPALMHATQIQLLRGAITPVQAEDAYDSLRFRWRGGAFELENIRALGQLYLSQGRYREALEAFRSEGKNLPDLPEAVQLQADLNQAFRSLFLDGQADGLQPVQALALFYDFKELTPVGADGDAMVRRLTRRLVDVDLLPQAEALLKYQVDNRLDGVPKAEVATDLAVIYLMDKKPEDALDAINASRTTALPNQLNLQRRIVTARALTGLGQFDTALEMLGADNSADATDARSEIVWRQKNWPAAGAIFEKMLGDRYRIAGPLSSVEEGQLLRAAVAYSLAADDVSLARLRDRWNGFVAGSRNPDALRVALSGINDGRVSPADISRIAADNQVFEGWVDKMKARFRETPLPAPRAPISARQATADVAPAPTPAKPAKSRA